MTGFTSGIKLLCWSSYFKITLKTDVFDFTTLEQLASYPTSSRLTVSKQALLLLIVADRHFQPRNMDSTVHQSLIVYTLTRGKTRRFISHKNIFYFAFHIVSRNQLLLLIKAMCHFLSISDRMKFFLIVQLHYVTFTGYLRSTDN